MQQMIFIADLIACSTCFGHHYAHHQELESIIQVVAACRIWGFAFQVVGMVWSWELCVRFAGCCCNKNHMLHLVGILFPHINDDARSKPHQIYIALMPINCTSGLYGCRTWSVSLKVEKLFRWNECKFWGRGLAVMHDEEHEGKNCVTLFVFCAGVQREGTLIW